MAENTLFLLDGTAQLFRAYFALPGLTNSEGMPTNAVFGFTTMLRKLLQDHRPTHLAVAFDVKAPTFRKEVYPEYKANRPPAPEDLNIQAPYARKVCDVLGVTHVEAEGFEADDLIATYTRQALEAGRDVVIVGSDKDLLQLVRDGVRVFNPAKEIWFDGDGIREQFGVGADQMLDVQAIMGDSVDNIPGVPGVGEKGAFGAVRIYGTLENAIARAGRFVEVYDLRDDVLAAIERVVGEDELIAESLSAFDETLARWSEAAACFVAAEADPEAAGRVQPARDAAAELDRDALEALVGGAGKKATRPFRELKKQLKAMDRGSGKRMWYAVHEHVDQARLSRQLATLNDASPTPRSLDETAVRGTDVSSAREFFLAMGFTTLTADLDAVSPEDSGSDGVAPETDYELVTTEEQLARVAADCAAADRVAVFPVAETADPHLSPLTGLAVAWDDGRAAYIPLGHVYIGAPESVGAAAVATAFAPWLQSSKPHRVAHDVKAAIHLLTRHEIVPAGWTLDLDTMVAAFLLNPGRSQYGLGTLAGELLGRTPGDDPSAAGKNAVSGLDVEPVGRYAAESADLLRSLAGLLAGRLEDAGLRSLYDEIDGPLLPLLARMESNGIAIDVPMLESMSRELGERIDRLRKKIHAAAGEEFNVDSPKQLREVLFDRLGLSPGRKTQKSKVASTGAETLEELTDKHPIAGLILEYRELAKLRSTYVDALPRLVHADTGRVHTCYHPTGAATGRLSSSDPNLQNIPIRTEVGRKIRQAFVAAPGHLFLASDYSQIELRVLAHLTEDEELTAAFQAGEDIHRYTAARVFGVAKDLVSDEMRRRAKAVNFGILYGMSETRLAREQGMRRADARRFIEAYFERFGRVRGYIDGVREQALRDGAVRTLFGRVRYFPQLHQRVNRGVQEQAYRAAVNTTIQGTAADLMKMAMLRVDNELRLAGSDARILLQVHDELLLELPEGELEATKERVRRSMEEIHPLLVPLVVDQQIGRNWYEAK